MNSLLLDTNIIIDAVSAEILGYLNCSNFSISNLVLNGEVLKQIPNIIPAFNIINETSNELIGATNYISNNKSISLYDAINAVIAKERGMILVTGDQLLIKFARSIGVNCYGTIKVMEMLIDEEKITPTECINAIDKLMSDSSRRVPHSLLKSLKERLISQYGCVL